MTLLAAPPTTDPLVDLHACIDALADLATASLGPSGQAATLESLTRAESRIAAVKLMIMAAADRDGAAASAGLADVGQWAARAVNADPIVVARQVKLSQGLEGREAVRSALGSGDLSPEHAAVIVQASDQLPTGVSADDRAVVEETLIEKARTMPPTLLRRAARRALAEIESDRAAVDAHEDQLLADEEARARSRTRLTLHDNGDGTVSGHFTVPVLQGHLLRKILETITAPRRGRLGASQHQVGDREARTDWDHARGTAFCELIEHLPTDHLHPRTAATVVVTMSDDVLRGSLAASGLDTGADLSSGEVRRLLCNATVIPAVLGGASLPLDLGRASRLYSDPQRTAVGLKYRTCAADGCERPFAWTELHHRDPWSQGGRTDLADAVPLCHFHHQRIHDRAYVHRYEPSGITFHRRT